MTKKPQTELEILRETQLQELESSIRAIREGYYQKDYAELIARDAVRLMSSFGASRSAFMSVMDLAETQKKAIL